MVAPSLGMISGFDLQPRPGTGVSGVGGGHLFALRRAVRNGSVWIEHSLSFRGPRACSSRTSVGRQSPKTLCRLSLPQGCHFLEAFAGQSNCRCRCGGRCSPQWRYCAWMMNSICRHLPAEDEDPEVTKLRAALDHRIGEVQLPEVILAVDAQVRFSWIMLGREPRSTDELLMVYAGIMAHGTSRLRSDARMIPQLSATSIRQAMRWARDERRLSQACQAVLEFIQRRRLPPHRGGPLASTT